MNEEIKKLKRAVIKEELIAITGNFIDAVILNQFIYWSERVKDFDEYIKQENDRARKCGQNPQDLTGGWIYKTADDMSSETMLGLSASNIRLHIKALEKAGFISERTNPKYKWDRTKQYRVNLNEIVAALTAKGYTLDGYQHYHIENATNDLKNQKTDLDAQNADIDAQTSQTKTAIPETTPETTAETPTKERATSRFTPPTAREVHDYCQEKGYHINEEKFISFYESIGWKVGKNKMKDWKAAVRTWVQRDKEYNQQSKQGTKQEEKHEVTMEEFAGDKLLPV